MRASPAGGRTLSHAEARRVYDRLGAVQDTQVFYERPALETLVTHLRLEDARAVVEFGCGTGRFAAELLAGPLPADARYLGLDVSTTMVRLARRRLEPFGGRAEVRQTDGVARVSAPDGAFDRFVSTYVFDLLSPEDMRAVLAEAHRVLAPGGLLGVAGLTPGADGMARVLSGVWGAIHRLRPSLVGGCRPVELLEVLPAGAWKLRHRAVVSPWGIASEAVVAERA